MRELVAGVDAGGTRTRAVVASLRGEVLGRAVGGPGNPTAHGVPVAVDSIVGAVVEALDGLDARGVVRVLVAAAGSTGPVGPRLRQALRKALAGHGVVCRIELRSDVAAAYAAGTDSPEGYVLVAGTGAVAGEAIGGELGRCVGGNGWLLGDDGGGFWLGREALRAVLAALDGSGDPTNLVDRVAAAWTIAPSREAVLAAAYSRPPVQLSTLAPVVAAAHADGDRVAMRIVSAAADALVRAISAFAPRSRRPLVLAGGVLTGDSPVAGPVCDAAAARWSLVPVPAKDPAAGAAWLALRDTVPGLASDAHSRLTGESARR